MYKTHLRGLVRNAGEFYTLWLCHVRKFCFTPDRGHHWESFFATVPATSKDTIRENISNTEEVYIWDIYNYNRVNRCALAEKHCYDRAPDPYDCHTLEL
ncbi:MAG: hypothetical protein AAF921_18315 [Cyanobacteria bacterium P01_D01_bin.44]